MEDLIDPPSASFAKPVLYGAALGAAAMVIFVAAYVVAPNLGLAGTFGIAAVLVALVAVAVNAMPGRAGEEMAALARGEDAPSDEAARPPSASRRLGALIEERVARTQQLRAEADAIDRRAEPDEWHRRIRALADDLKELATLELSIGRPKGRRAGLAHVRQAASLYRRIVTAREEPDDRRGWGTAQLALGECLLVLGEAENARDEVLTAANAFAAGLEVADLDAGEREAGQKGLERAEGMLTAMAEPTRAGDDDVI